MARVRVKRTLERFVIWLAALAVVPFVTFLALTGLHVRPAVGGWVAGLAQGLLCVPLAFEVRRNVLARLAAAAKAEQATRRATARPTAKGGSKT